MSAIDTLIVSLPDAPQEASIGYRRLWLWTKFHLQGRRAIEMLRVLETLVKLASGSFSQVTRMPVGSYAFLFAHKIHRVFGVDEVAEMQIEREVGMKRLVRDLNFAKFPLTDRERVEYGQLVNLVLDGVSRDSHLVTVTVSEIRMMTRELLDIIVDQYGLSVEDGIEMGLEPAI